MAVVVIVTMTANGPLEGLAVRFTETRAFSQGWLFHSGDTPWWQPTGEKFDAVLDRWRKVVLPHCFNAEDTFTPARGFYRGAVWYRKTFTLPPEASGRKVFIEFGAAAMLADVWINERHAGQFMGGYTGFGVDATDLMHPGDNLIAVRVDNSHDPDVLPGLHAHDMDYVVYGGLYREACVVVKDMVHIRQHGVTVATPVVSNETANLQISVVVANDCLEPVEYECRAILRDAHGKAAAETSGRAVLLGRATATVQLDMIEVVNPALWSVDDPNLYSIEVQLVRNGEPVDAEFVTVGLRWFEFTPDRGFFLNGKHVKLRGLNRHQDYPGLGNALPPRLQVRDAELLKEMGANFVRLSHYPQHPAFLDACDRLGILAYEEIASWQYIGGEMFARNAEWMLREMIRRDKNHPSIILWGLLNEGRSKCLFDRLHQAAKECDPTRPTVYADNRPKEGMERGTVFVPDVLGINYELEHLDEFRAALPGLKFVSSETTNYEHRRRGDVTQDIAQVGRLMDETGVVEQREYMAGMALWSMHDYATDYELSWSVQPSGVFDACRFPKGGYWFLRSRWSGEPVVRIIGHWNWTGREGEDIPILVCSNADSVELFLNDRSLGAKPGKYIARWEVPYTRGTLRAVARCGNAITEHCVRTSGRPAALLIESSPEILIADGADSAEVTITVVDQAGEPVLDEDGYAAFRLEGPATLRGIAGIPSAKVLAGRARIVIQAKTEPGNIVVRAAYRGLPEATVILRSQ